MEFISTTSTAVEKLKRSAKTLRKTSKTSLAVALDAIAKQHGYEHWKHVTVCQEQTASISGSRQLPKSLQDILDQATSRHPASAESQKAFAEGFVFAMDVKDAEQLALTPEYAECEDGWYLAADDLWRELIHQPDDETGTTLFETQAPEDLAGTALDDLQNYRFFRYLGAVTPASLEEAYKQASQLSFFPPTHVWLGGKFINVLEVPEIRVDGHVVLSSSPGGTRPSPTNSRDRFEKFGHRLDAAERELFDKMTKQEQDFWLLQLEKQTPMGQARYQPVHSTVTSSWRSAGKD